MAGAVLGKKNIPFKLRGIKEEEGLSFLSQLLREGCILLDLSQLLSGPLQV